MPGVMNDDLIDIENKLSSHNFETIKLLGAGGGGYFLVQYKGNNMNSDLSNLKEKFDIKKIELETKGSKSWKI